MRVRALVLLIPIAVGQGKHRRHIYGTVWRSLRPFDCSIVADSIQYANVNVSHIILQCPHYYGSSPL